MKKKLIILLGFFLSIQVTFSQEEQKTPSKVAKATVFLNKAQINRTIQVSLRKGVTVLIFNELSPFIDVKSIQVKTSPNVAILAVNHKNNYLNKTKKSDKVEELENRLEKLEEQISLENTYKDIVLQNIDFLQQNKSIGGKNQILTANNLKLTADYYASEYKKLKLEEVSILKKRDKLYQEKSKVNKEIKTIRNQKEYPTGEIFVKVEALNLGNTTFEVTYLVDNVSWFPSYDIKVTDINNPIQLTYKANLQQNSKVDWNNVELVFSSDNPSVSGVAPVLNPYKLSFNQKRNQYKSFSHVKGSVKDQSGEPLVGTTISAVGSNIATVSDFDGRYSMSLPNGTQNLQASYLGFLDQTKNITNDVVNFRLQEDSNELDEVVVVGYGTQKKKEITGAISSVNASDIDLALRGRVAGVNIRGMSSISGNSSPLYVVDGIPYDKNPNLNPDEIASIDVLKDAANSSIYGSRASSGVVLITTKNGANAITTLNQTAVNFKIEKKQTVKSATSSKEIKLQNILIPATYQYFTVPKINKSAYLIAKIKDWEKYQLLDGETNIFFDNTFKNKGVLDLENIKEEIIISLGVDKQIDIERTQVTENSSQKFLSKNVEINRHWKIDVKNNKNQNINIQVLDQFPVSVTDVIKVELIENSNATIDNLSGELKWFLDIPKTTSKALNIQYKVKHPKNRKLIIE